MNPVLDTDPTRGTEEARRLRASYLRLKGAICDPITGLSSYALHLDEIEMHCAGRRLGIIVLEFPSLGALEQAHGWEFGDRFLAGVAAHLRALNSRIFPASTLISLDGVYGNAFTMFLREGLGGCEIAISDLADAAGTDRPRRR